MPIAVLSGGQRSDPRIAELHQAVHPKFPISAGDFDLLRNNERVDDRDDEEPVHPQPFDLFPGEHPKGIPAQGRKDEIAGDEEKTE
jgi:hypothetical protein